MSVPLASIIIPSYNNEHRIVYSLQSAIEQDYENIEIIFVNDCSTDNTLKNAEDVLKNCGRPYKIINHEKNSGVSISRNDGILNSSGEYLCFCDGDDLMKKNYVSSLIDLIQKYDCDISFGGMIDKFEDGHPDKSWPVKIDAPNPIPGGLALKLRIYKSIVPHVCAMMFRKKFLLDTGLKFPEHCSAGEDVEFQLKAFCRTEKAAFTSECVYIYFHNPEMGSIRDNNTLAKKLRRYSDSAGASYRTAEYIEKFAPSEEIKSTAKNFLMPEAVIRKFTAAAMKNDRDKYKNLYSDKNLRKILLRSIKFFFKNPEIFLKAMLILIAPGFYFKLRVKNS